MYKKRIKKQENIIFQYFLVFLLEATPGFEPGIRVLQTRALPLGYIAEYMERETGLKPATSALARQRSIN